MATNCKTPSLSARGTAALNRPPLLRCALFENQYAPSNPRGLLNLGVAENSLMTNWLIDYFESHFHLTYSDVSTYGSALGGSIRLYAALQLLFAKHFNARIPVTRDHIIAGSGCGSVIDLLVSCLTDEGDGILVARPYYNGFSACFGCRNTVRPVGVTLSSDPESSDAIADFQTALHASNESGTPIRALVLSNPHNPLGFCYSRDVLLEYCKFAERHDLHLIVDEIYALSTYKTADSDAAQPFTSILSVDPMEVGCNPARVHAVYGASKDFGANGLRIGALVSQHNPELHQAMESSCLLMKISSASDALWSSLLLDQPALNEYLALNRARLSQAYDRCTSFLKTHNIPYRPANAGHFIWIDLRRFLPQAVASGKPLQTEVEKEEALAARFLAEGVNVARGSAYCHPEAGFFRLTFTLRPDYFMTGLSRLEKALGLPSTVSVALVRRLSGDAEAEAEQEDLTRSISSLKV